MKGEVLALMILIVLLSLDALGHENEEDVTDDSQEHVAADSQKEVYDVVRTCLSQSEETDACYVKSCKNESKYLCAEEILEAAVLISGPEKAMEILQDIMASSLFGLSGSQTVGHSLSHIIGRSTSKYLGETGEFFLRCPVDFSYGCHHGFFEVALAEHNEPVKAAESICESLAPSGARDRFCYHGVGHGFMFHESYDLIKALSLCDSFPARTAQQACWDGVFMENVRARLRKEAAALPNFREEDPLAPCSYVESKYLDRCYARQGSYLVYLNSSPESATNECLGAGNYTRSCMVSIGVRAAVPNWQERLAGSFKGSFAETAVHICNRFPAGYVQTCYRAVLKHLVYELKLNDSSEFCMAINVTSECFKWISSNISQVVADGDQYEKACNALPDEFRDDCLGRKRELPNYGGGAHNKTGKVRETTSEDGNSSLKKGEMQPSREHEATSEDGSSLEHQWTEEWLTFLITSSLKKAWIFSAQ